MSEESDILESQKQQDDGEFLPAPEESGASATGAVIAGVGDPTVRVGHYRWMICALLFFAATVNYIDRQVLGILKPTLQAEFGWTETGLRLDRVLVSNRIRDRSSCSSANLMDRFGTKKGFCLFDHAMEYRSDGCTHGRCRSVCGAAAALNWFGYISNLDRIRICRRLYYCPFSIGIG